MGKDSNFTGQPVYNQVLNLLDREIIMQISRETPGSEAYVKRFDGYQHLVVMLFGILKHFDSLRELEIGMKAEAHKLHHHRIPLQTAQAEFPPALLLWRQRQCHTDTNVGRIDCQSAHHSPIKEDKTQLCFLAGGHHDTPYPYVLHRFHTIYG